MPSGHTKNKRSPRGHGAKQSPVMYEAVLEGLRKGLTPKYAAQQAGVGRATIFEWKDEDPEFAKAWDAAVEEGVDMLETEARRRAVEGCERPVFQGGIEVGRIREYSDTLMVLMLKGRRQQVYNTERHEHTGAGGQPIETKTEVTVRFVAATKGKK